MSGPCSIPIFPELRRSQWRDVSCLVERVFCSARSASRAASSGISPGSLTGTCATERRPVHPTGAASLRSAARPAERHPPPPLQPPPAPATGSLRPCRRAVGSPRCAGGSPPDGCWDGGGHGAENPIKRQFQALALRR